MILTSYEADFAAEFGAKVRRSLKDNKDVFRRTLDKDTDKYFTIEGHRGYMQSVGVGGAITGKGADLVIIDDPIKNAEQAMSATYRQRTWDWYRSTIYTRLSSEAIVIVVVTRWHVDDLVGRLLKAADDGEGDDWHVIALPALAEENDPLGRLVGEPLAPELFSLDQLHEIKRVLGPYWWSALYRQRPTSEETQIIHRSWWQRYEIPPSFEYVFQSWDTALKDDELNDYTCCTTWGVTRTGIYLVNILYEKLQFPELREAIQNRASMWKPNVVLIEDKTSGTSVIQDLRKSTRLPIIDWKVDSGSKIVRLHLNSGVFSSGRVHIPYGPEYDALIEEVATFPRVPNDDRTDSTSQALSFYRTKLMHVTHNEGSALDRLQTRSTGRRSTSRHQGFL